jgi:hypothetical protein
LSKDTKTYSLFNKWCWEKWIFACRKLKLDQYLSPCANISSKWIKELSKRLKTLKLLQKRIGKTMENKVIGKNVLDSIAIKRKD